MPLDLTSLRHPRDKHDLKDMRDGAFAVSLPSMLGIGREGARGTLRCHAADVRGTHDVKCLKVALEASLDTRLFLATERLAWPCHTLAIAFVRSLADQLLCVGHGNLSRHALFQCIFLLRRRGTLLAGD